MPAVFYAWSYSRLSDWEQCPRRAKLKHLDKIQEPSNPAMERGSQIHKLAEDFVAGRIKKLPVELIDFEKKLKQLKKRGAVPEQQWAFTKDWAATSWFGLDAYCRMICDVIMVESNGVVTVIDYKTGKVRDEHREQLSLYALGAFIMNPIYDRVQVSLYYVDQKTMTKPVEFTRDQFEALKKEWTDRAAPMLIDKQFVARPGHYCRWCYFNNSNTGHCEF
jgi:CRISPR/Cas system-associated exonuclease Cas4 (RecB family)